MTKYISIPKRPLSCERHVVAVKGYSSRLDDSGVRLRRQTDTRVTDAQVRFGFDSLNSDLDNLKLGRKIFGK